MGKQINYYVDYENFLLVAQKALDLGCTIVREDLRDKTACTVEESGKLDIIINERQTYYFFHLPEAGNISIKKYDCGYRLDHGFNESGNSVIEANFSRIYPERKSIVGERLYLTTGYYDKNEEFVYRPDCIVKVYNSLARYVKKLAPYTEFTGTHVFVGGDRDGETEEYKYKEYITPYLLELKEKEGYRLS